MKKTLRFITIFAGLISLVSAIMLGCMYLEDFFGFVSMIKKKVTSIICFKKPMDVVE